MRFLHRLSVGHALSCLTALMLAMTGTLHAEPVKLEPNAQFTLDFPELPATYYQQKTGKQTVPQLSVQLPEDYAAGKTFPLFVFIDGGNGGAGANVAFTRRIIGPRGFIAVNLPLFKDPKAKPPVLPGVTLNMGSLVNSNDASVLSTSYQAMLEKLAQTVPNIATERSTLGGFSNGAHATSVLAASKDAYILKHFSAFILMEGGIGFALNPSAMGEPALQGHRFLVLYGDTEKKLKNRIQRTLVAVPLIKLVERQARSAGIDLTHLTMSGYGHEEPPPYLELIGAWVRGETLPEVK